MHVHALADWIANCIPISVQYEASLIKQTVIVDLFVHSRSSGPFPVDLFVHSKSSGPFCTF